MHSKAVNSEYFKRACGRFLTGIAIVTVVGADGLPHGITVNSFTSVSLEPPRVLVCIDCRAQFMTYCAEGGNFGINILQESQLDLSRRFARKESERFSGIEWYLGTTGVPLLPLVLATMECRLTARIIEGDHVVLFGQVLSINYYEGNPLAYFKGLYRRLDPEAMGAGRK
jgi:flavin reductase (DIM6/NTAB) family NADH-FMN oxidoreductase RutF